MSILLFVLVDFFKILVGIHLQLTAGSLVAGDDAIGVELQSAEPDSVEAALYKDLDADAKQFLEQLFVDMVMGAGERMNTIHNAFGKDTAVGVNTDSDITDTKGEKHSMPKVQNKPYKKPAYDEWDVREALDDALDHADHGYDNLIKVGNMPNFITDLTGIEGEFYIYRNHAYENMVSKRDAEKANRPTVRGGNEIHFHNLGKQKMIDAILSLENPIMTIADSEEFGNPEIVMVLPVCGNNDSPLYAALSFYSNTHIKGKWTKKPHIVLTISERGMIAEGGYDGHLEVINKAIESGNVLSYDKQKMRDYLSVIANHTRVGNITSRTLTESVAQFRKFVNKFREKNHIDYKLPNTNGVSSRKLLADAFDELVQTPKERELMDAYRSNIAKVEDVQERLRKLRAEISRLSKAIPLPMGHKKEHRVVFFFVFPYFSFL